MGGGPLARDGRILVRARGVRMFSYGFLSVILALYLSAVGFSPAQIGVLFTVALAGGAGTTAVVSLLVERWGRRRALIVSALLMVAAGAALGARAGFFVLLPLAAVGALSPTGQEIGPFQSLEQAALAQTSRRPDQVMPYAWYNLVGSAAAALGALLAGAAPLVLRALGWASLASEQALVWLFAAAGLVLATQYLGLSESVEVTRRGKPGSPPPGLAGSRGIVVRLAALFGVDALAGGLVVQGLIAFWFYQRFGVGPEWLGPLFFGTNLLSALSYLVAARLADRFGLLNTIVFTHLPSNVLLALVPFMPSWPLCAATLLARSALSQMDVPTRQAFTMALVAPEERAAAAGLTNAVRPAAQSIAPAISGFALQSAASGLPFVLAGGLKSAYDLTLWLAFRRVLPASGQGAPGTPGLEKGRPV
jgi:MFS family permease